MYEPIGRGTKILKVARPPVFFKPQKEREKKKNKTPKKKRVFGLYPFVRRKKEWGKEKKYWVFSAIRGFLSLDFFCIGVSTLSVGLSVCVVGDFRFITLN